VLDDPMLSLLKGLAKFATIRVAGAIRARVGANKVALARLIIRALNSKVDPDALFDVQIKRIHEYKRQLLNILETVARYNAIRAKPMRDLGAAGQDLRRQGGGELSQAKLIIKLINDVAGRQQRPDGARPAEGRVPANYNVSLAEVIIPPPTSPSRSRPPAWRPPAPAT
jgi:starch phosphorylase